MDSLKDRIAFIVEIDKLKTILRQTLIMSGGRRENSAEHSWHLSMMVLTLHPYFKEKVDILKCLKMALVHDIVEIDAGDVFVYDDKARALQEEIEKEAAERIFGLLPKDIGEELKTIWLEFEESKSAEARFVKGIDRLQPILCNLETEGHSWKKHDIKRWQVDERNAKWVVDFNVIDEYVTEITQKAVDEGLLKEGPKPTF